MTAHWLTADTWTCVEDPYSGSIALARFFIHGRDVERCPLCCAKRPPFADATLAAPTLPEPAQETPPE